MDRFGDSLEAQDPYEQTSDLMRQSLVTVEHNCHSLRDEVKQQQNSIMDSLRKCNDNPAKAEALEATLRFYDHVRAELVDLEAVCHEYRVKIKADVASEMLQRLQPPAHTSIAAVSRPYHNLLRDRTLILDHVHSKRASPMSQQRLHNWTNVSLVSLDRTENIIYGPKSSMPSEFDEGDEKFKQEVMMLRTKMFAMPRNGWTNGASDQASIPDHRTSSADRATRTEFIETERKSVSYVSLSPSVELAKVDNLKFVDGEFNSFDLWTKVLDSHGQQLRSRWCLVVCPRIEALLKKHKISTIHLSPARVFDFLTKLPENGRNCELSRKDLLPLAERAAEIRSLLDSRMQFRGINGRVVAATIVQSCWRGFWIRKCLFEAKCKYVAASIIWVAWIVVKKKRQMHERYLRNMLTSLDLTRRLGTKLSSDYSSIVRGCDHVILHLSSAGYPQDVRRTFGSGEFAIYQNTMGLKWSFVKNPRARVICLLPVGASGDLSEMYREAMTSVSPKSELAKRVTFLELSQAATFVDRSFNVSRTLHASEDTLVEIRKILDEDEKPAFCVPWIMDECDVRVAGNFNVPLLAPDLEMQREILDKSRMSSTLEKIGLEQPACVTDLRDYRTLCDKLAEQICSNTEICVWLFKLNVGSTTLHTGVFLINHMSVPFMPILRKERDSHGNQWASPDSKTRANFLKSLRDHLPLIVSTVTRFSKCYRTWNDFYAHVTKYGCLLQAVPGERSARYISVALFVPGNSSGESIQWTGTAELIYSARKSRFFTVGYTMPQTFVDNAELEPTIDRLSDALRQDGYFGHLCVDLCCFRRKLDDKLVSLVIETKPCYEYVQHYVDWIELACDGSYNRTSNKFYADSASLLDLRTSRSSTSAPPYEKDVGSRLMSETKERYAVAIGDLRHTEMSSYSWKQLAVLNKKCGIDWNNSTRTGSHLFLHDCTSRKSAMLIIVATGMESAMGLTKNCLKKMCKALDGEKTNARDIDSNFLEIADYIDEALEKHRISTVDKCDPFNRVR